MLPPRNRQKSGIKNIIDNYFKKKKWVKLSNNRPKWTSRYSFILAAIGCAVGLGQNGGAVFLLTFVFFILTICFIPMITEILFGKITKKECIGAFESINPKFKYIGMLNPLTAIIVPSFYFVIGGWIINYLYKSFIGFKAPDYAQYLNSFVQAPVITTFLTLCFLFV